MFQEYGGTLVEGRVRRVQPNFQVGFVNEQQSQGKDEAERAANKHQRAFRSRLRIPKVQPSDTTQGFPGNVKGRMKILAKKRGEMSINAYKAKPISSRHHNMLRLTSCAPLGKNPQ